MNQSLREAVFCWMIGFTVSVSLGDTADEADLVIRLRSPGIEARCGALREAALRFGPGRPIEAVRQCLADPYWDVRRQAVRTMVAYGADVVPVLVDLLEGTNYPSAGCAAQCLAELGRSAKPSAGALGRALRGGFRGDPAFRRWVSLALSRLGADARPAMSDIIASLHLEQSRERLPGDEDLFRALAAIGPDAAEVVPDMIRLLTSVDAAQYSGSFETQKTGEGADDPLDVNVSRLNRAGAKMVLIGIGGKAIHPVHVALTGRAYAGSTHFELAAIDILGHGGTASKPSVRMLAEMAASSNGKLYRMHAVQALGRLAGHAREAVPTLCAIVRSPMLEPVALDEGMTPEVMARMKKAQEAKGAAFRETGVKPAPDDLRAEALTALVSIGRDDARVAQVLAEAITDRASEVRAVASGMGESPAGGQ